MSFTSVDNVKAFLNRETLTPAQTSLVQMLIGLIDGVICNYCGWSMLATSYTGRKFDGNGLEELDLKVYPINALTKVMLDGVDITAGITQVEEEGILIYTDQTFTAGRRNVVIDFNAGFAEGAIPPDLQYAANYLIAINFTRIDDENIGIKTEKFNQVEVTYDSTDIPVLVKRVLDRFRLISIY